MKKWIRGLLILSGIVIVLFAALTIVVRAYLTPERIKAYLIPEAERALGRKVAIGDIDISLFKGITVNDLSVREADDRTVFFSCREFVLTYKLLPLLSRQLVIDELRLSGPEIFLIRDASGAFNYETIGRRPGGAGEEKASSSGEGTESQPLPVSLLVDQIKVMEAGLTFSDRKKELPGVKGRWSADMSVRFENGSIPQGGMKDALSGLRVNGSVKLAELLIEKGSARIILAGDIQFTEKTVSADITSTVGKNTAQIKGRAENLSEDPDIRLDLYAKELKIEELLAVAAAGEGSSKPEKPDNKTGEKERGADKDGRPGPMKFTASGEIKIDSAQYKAMTMTDFRLSYTLKKNVFEISEMTAAAGKGRLQVKSRVDMSGPVPSFTAAGKLDSLNAEEVVNAFSPKAKGTVFGQLSANLSLEGSGSASENLKKNLIAEGDFTIKDGRITNTGLADDLAVFLGINELRTIHVRQGNGTVRVRNGVARLESIFSSDDIAMNPGGNIGLNETLDLAFDLKLSPRLTATAARSANVASYIKDDRGWGRIPLRVTGTFSRPSYGIDVSKAGKRIIEKKGEELLRKFFQ